MATEDQKDQIKQNQIDKIITRITLKTTGRTGTTDVQLLLLERIGDLLLENNRLLRAGESEPVKDVVKPWWKFY